MSEVDLRWRRTLDGWALPRLPVVLHDGSLLVRRADLLLRLDPGGDEEWRQTPGQTAAGGVLTVTAEVVVTTAAGPDPFDERLTTYAPDGTRLVRAPVGGNVAVRGALGGTTDRRDVVDVLVVDRNGRTSRQVVVVATGSLGRRDPLPHGGDELLIHGESLLVTSRAATSEGLVRLDPDGGRTEVLAEACWSAQADDRTLVATCAPSAVALGTVHVLEVAGLGERWSRPGRPEGAGLAPGAVVAGDPADPSVVVALDLETGEARWSSAPLGVPLLAIRGAGGLVWCTHVAGVVTLAADDGRELFRLDGMWSAPTVAGGTGYALGEESLVCFDVPAAGSV